MTTDPRIEAAAEAFRAEFPTLNNSIEAYRRQMGRWLAAADKAEGIEYGITWITDDGTLRTEWGYSTRPELDADEEFQVGKREFVHVLEILTRPKSTEASIWQSEECPWKDPR